MAFDLRFENKKEKIEPHEEGLFLLVNEDDRYPALNWLWQEFYDSPRIQPERCNEIVHELIFLQSLNGIAKEVQHIIARLLPFFSMAYTNSKQVNCASD